MRPITLREAARRTRAARQDFRTGRNRAVKRFGRTIALPGAAVAAGLLLLAGCVSNAVVTSYPTTAINEANYAAKGRAYLQYSLQRTVVTVAIDDASAGASSPGGAQDPNAKPGAATDPGAPTGNAPAPANPPPPKKPAPGHAAAAAPAAPATPDPPPTGGAGASALSSCADLRKLYDQNLMTFLTYKAAQAQLESALATWTNLPSPRSAPQIAQLNTAIVNYANAWSADQGASTFLASEYPIIVGYCPPTLKITVTQKDEPDPDKSYLLVINSSAFFDDQVNLQGDGNSGLVSVGYTSTDETTQILTNFATSITTLTVSGLGLPTTPSPLNVNATGRPNCLAELPADKNKQLIAATRADEDTLNACLYFDESADKASAPPQPIDVAHYERAFPAETLTAAAILPYNLKVHLHCSPPPTATTATPFDGVAASTPLPCVVAVGMAMGDGGVSAADQDYATSLAHVFGEGFANERVLNRTPFVAMNSNAPIVLPVSRTSFDTRTATYAFTNGRLTGATYNRPSPLVNAALLPSTIFGAVIGAATGEIKSRSDNTTARTNDLKAETDNINARAALRQAEAAAAAPATGAAAPTH